MKKKITMQVADATKQNNPSLLFDDDDLLQKFYEANKERSIKEITKHGGLCPTNLLKNIDEDIHLTCNNSDISCNDCKLRIFKEEQIDERLQWIYQSLNIMEVYTNF